MKQPVSSLRQWMLEQYAPQFHLEKKTLLKQLDQVGFYAERCLPPAGQLPAGAQYLQAVFADAVPRAAGGVVGVFI